MVRNLLLFFVSFIFLLIVSSFPVLAQENFGSGEVVSLNEDQIISGNYFAGGEKVTLSGTVNGDVYLAGGTIIVDGVVNGDLLLAGGNITIDGVVTGDVRSVGGNLNISGNVGRNITALGGSITVNNLTNFRGSVVAAGGNVQIYSPIPEGITVAAGTLTIGDVVGSNVYAGVGDLTLTSKAQIDGDLVYYSDKEATIQSGSTVSGTILQKSYPSQVREKRVKTEAKALLSGFTVFNFLSRLLMGLVFIVLFPVFMNMGSDFINRRFWASLGLGLLIFILVPFAAVLLFMTVIGLPIGMMLLVGYLFILFFSHLITSFFVGQKVLGIVKRKGNYYVTFSVGLVILTVLSLIPVFGLFVRLVSILVGTGALVATKYSLYRSFRKNNLL